VVNKYKSDDVSGDAVRHDIVMFIASNKQLRGDLEERLQVQGMSIGDYIVNMSKGTTWIDDNAFFAASLLYNVTIYILKEGCTAPVVIGSADSDRSVVLGYVSSCSNDIYDHYVSLIASTISTTSMATAASVPDEQSSGTSSTTVQSTTRTATATAGPNAESKTLSSASVLDISSSATDRPVQPMLTSFKRTQVGSTVRSFSSHWYKKFPTIEYSAVHDAVFCFVCHHFQPANAYAESVFRKTGFSNWKKFGSRMQQHIECNSHLDAVAQWQAQSEAQVMGNVTVQMSTQQKTAVLRNREAVSLITRAVLFCARQDIALRGHRESATVVDSSSSSSADIIICHNRGNVIELLDLLKDEHAETRKKLNSLPRNATYTSKDSQNELLTAASSVVLETIVEQVRSNGGIYSVIADEARDNSCTEKMSVCIRYVDGTYVHEWFLGFVDVFRLDAQSLSTSLVTFLEQRKLSIKNCVGQAYDGASVMSGEFAGVQKLVREQSSYPCPYVHCYAHRLNLVLVDVSKRVNTVGATFGLFEAIYSFQSVSTLLHDVFVRS